MPIGVARTLDVAADREPERLVRVALGAQHASDLAGCARGGDHQAGVDRVAADADTGRPAVVVEHRLGLGLEPHVGTGVRPRHR